MSLPDTNISSLTDSEIAYSTEAPGINVTQPRRRGRPPKEDAMSGAERAAAYRARAKATKEAKTNPLRHTSDEWRDFVDKDKLERKAGMRWHNMPGMVLRELADNAADAADTVGGAIARIDVVYIDGDAWWCIGDEGKGIIPKDVEGIFNVRRPMASTKHMRLPTRGMLGNGTRVVAGYCAIEGLPIWVESHGRRTTLRIDATTGYTTAEQQPIEARPCLQTASTRARSCRCGPWRDSCRHASHTA